ncbi:GNAT family N-acetyltransferase [Falsiroseomonas bella]|nr:GNAT family N-acetyltransferase [Falsiroseomonas bella]
MPPRPLTEDDLPRAVALSATAGWNQTAEDWRVFLRQGQVRTLDDGHPDCLAATAAVLPFGPDLAWISMVLVRPDRRRGGLATALMRWAVEALSGTRCIALDATPEGREVYRRLGFEDRFGFARWRLGAAPSGGAAPARALRAEDWDGILDRDAAAFGVPRESLLRGFAARLPQAAWITQDGADFALGRDGFRLPQIGPVVARSPAAAVGLVAAARGAIGGPALLDLADDQAELALAIEAAGAQRLRRFTRMTLGTPLPGAPGLLVAMAGPEFG